MNRLTELNNQRTALTARVDECEKVMTFCKTPDLEAEVTRIKAEIEQLELERTKVGQAGKGAPKLDVTLARLDAKRDELTAQIAECEKGKASFAKEVADTRAAAKAALLGFARVMTANMIADKRKKAKEAGDDVVAATQFLDLLDAACIAESVRRLSASGASHGLGLAHGVEQAVEKILTDKPVPALKPDGVSPLPKVETAETPAAKRKPGRPKKSEPAPNTEKAADVGASPPLAPAPN